MIILKISLDKYQFSTWADFKSFCIKFGEKFCELNSGNETAEAKKGSQ